MWNKVLLFGGNGALDKLNHHKDKTTGLHFRGVQVVRRVRGGDTVQYLDTRVAPHLRQAQFGLRVQALRYIFRSELLAPLPDLGRHCFVCGARPCSVCLYHRQREIGCRTLVWSNARQNFAKLGSYHFFVSATSFGTPRLVMKATSDDWFGTDGTLLCVVHF